MTTVSYSYYINEYCGELLEQDEFCRLEKRAERAIDLLIHGKLKDYSSFPSNIQEAVTNAICSQVEYMLTHGIDVTVSGTDMTGFTVGKVSMSGGGKSKGAASMVAPSAIAFLEVTGLMNPQVDTFDRWWY